MKLLPSGAKRNFAVAFKHVKVEERDKFLWITLYRPLLHNAFNEEVIAELTAAFLDPEVGPNVEKHKGVVLTGDESPFPQELT